MTMERGGEHFDHAIFHDMLKVAGQPASFQIRNHFQQRSAARITGMNAGDACERGIPYLNDQVPICRQYPDEIRNHIKAMLWARSRVAGSIGKFHGPHRFFSSSPLDAVPDYPAK